MVKDSDMPSATCETLNGHSNVDDKENYEDLTQKLKSLCDTSLPKQTVINDKTKYVENILTNKNCGSFIEEDVDDGVFQKMDSINNESINKETFNEKNEGIIDASKEQEFVFIHDAGFVVKIIAPGVEPFDIQVSSTELVQEIHQMLMDREETCHRTCFSLQLDGVTMDNFAELKTIEGLKDGSVIKVVEEPYTVREARIHVRHIRDLLKSLDPADAFNGVECSSFSFLNTITQGDILEKKKCRPDSVDCTPLDYILPSVNELPLLPLQPQSKDPKIAPALKVLMISGWNPPPGLRKLRGDLLYLYVVTAEDKRLHITASTRGFYINQTTDEEFNPKPANPKLIFHSLADLLGQVSPMFKRNFSIIQKKRTQRHPFERVATPYQVYTWTAPNLEHSIDSIRAEDAFSSKLGYEEHIPGQTRDWNEELQTTRELPRKTLPERLIRERAIFKVHSDFVTAATRGAMAVVDGNVMALNPGEETKMQMFIWNNIFFSLGFDVRDHYKEVGGDAAAFSAPNNDLQGVRAYNAVDIDGLYTLGTVVIDYRGYRVTAQSIIPGILEREQEHSVVYGSVDFGKTVLSHPKYLEMLNKAGQSLKILPHSVLNEKDEEVELCSSVECKGIVGNDGRHYILDLLRTFPPDVNFLILEGEELSKEAQALGFPREHKHKLCCLRQELIDAFVDARYMMFIKLAAFHLQQIGLKNYIKDKQAEQEENDALSTGILKCNNSDKETAEKNQADDNLHNSEEKKNSLETDEYKKIVESITNKDKSEVDSTREVIKKAALAVGSLKETEFDIRFNPDVFSPGVRHPTTHPEKLSKEKQLAKDAADFLLTVQIPGFVRDCLEHSTSPIDGATLTEALHGRGISIRYLGKIADMVAKVPQLQYVLRIIVSELLTRAAKHLFSHYIQGVETMCLSSATSHFLNCFLSSCTSLPSPVSSEEQLQVKYKRKGKRKGKQNPLRFEDNNEWALLSTKTFWNNMKNELLSYYAWELPCDSIDAIIEHFSLQKISLMRSFCIKTGIQLLLREYNFDHKTKPTFTEDDILNIFPVVKHINPRATDAYNFYTTGQNKIQQGYLKEGYELITEALNLLNNVYGAMHPEISQCLRMLARLNYIMGDHQEAMAFQQKAVLMSERVNGIDHAYTISEYTHLALYCFANSQITTALKLLYRARYLTLLVCGENHPEMAVLDSNIGLILHAVGEYDLSLRFLENALKLNINYYGSKSLKVAVSYHLVARTQSCMGEFRGALQNEKETYSIYKQQLGEDHDKTKESSECLRHLTQQAVVLQKKMNEIYKGNSSAILPPIQIQPPSLSSVLDMLNIINGILFVQISQQDIENFRAEFERRQQKDSDTAKKTDSDIEANNVSEIIEMPSCVSTR
ncbi:clustered mitochondria protein homolog isoform X1 [Stegodyphus dumicola]|uniref:clustered mitochondria protein homolog isoform X1 n=1 Tax=Stegodyphus dumicola TaxID=202533 RepID=UPI0015A7E4D7|nr:clustered mitochondria protein homolog isoform X1 [Stegodyphus dumicola]XP_035227138.1 clustered mitochondria protein homolog isoform X1 [Stegodyphus dumicola]XP_035227139.1 clustered mitochondria protein homolog isoform X1 [Stegodyphus dumicola]XP_035227140.1 clustered mitochondria protein homolog isoform X1 [Stegodyphus dumicola]XP_035227141.1 clustered mitochondria protein homolog isoform X1 [Stegodyphus dumicola]